MPNRPQRATSISGVNGLSGVFNDQQSMSLGDLHDPIHFTTDASVMIWNDRSRSRRNSCFDLLFVDIHRVGSNIDEHRFGPQPDNGIGRRNKRIGWQDNLVTVMQVAEYRGDL